MTRLVLTLFLGLATLVAGCDVFGPGRSDAALRSLTAAERRVVEADRTFGLELFQALSEAEPDGNVFVSPLSVSMALGMTLNGASGDTRTEMEEALGKRGLTQAEINESYRSLIDLLADLDPSVRFDLANSIWYRDDFEARPEFLDLNREYFDAAVERLDFGAPGAADRINDWVDDKTAGKIERIIEAIGPNAVMYLINAVYFDGKWTYAFDEMRTADASFANADGTIVEVPMMALSQDLPLYADERVQAVDLPYGDGGYSMTIVLPRAGQSVNELAAELDGARWAALAEGFQTREVQLHMPRFELEYDVELNDVLESLGMRSAFDPNDADFTRIREAGELYISMVKHKAFVEVNEAGTKAAAATSVEVSLTSVSDTTVRVDRPFLFVIGERHSGTILFIGKVLSL